MFNSDFVWKYKKIQKYIQQILEQKLLKNSCCKLYVNGKAIPLQAWTCPEGSRRLRFPDFKTINN
jgi:hypothetical protein